MTSNPDDSLTEIRLRGKTLLVKSLSVGSRTVVVNGRWLRVASLKSEHWQEGQPVEDPKSFIATLRSSHLKADVFTFPQRVDESDRKHDYLMEWDNVAALSTASYSAWWERLSQVARKNVRRAERRGVTVRELDFDDDLVRGIVGIYNADQLRQTGRFWHYGKGFEQVKTENSSFLDRSCFIGAFFGEELIGFIKMVYTDNSARLMQIVCKNDHRDKRPIYLLISRAVAICEQKGIAYLIYGKYTYGNKNDSTLTDFKRRTGFEKMEFPRYYVPLTLKGRLAVALRLHRGLLGLLPGSVISVMVQTRLWVLRHLRNEADANASGREDGQPASAEPAE